jgi:gamma-glutamyltranspeptidase/glutathione hydrolase
MPELAATLRELGRRGSAPFYRGRIAREIVAANRRNGGIMAMADLRDYRVVEREPLEARRMGFRWVTAPAPSAGGYTMLASLGLLDRWIPAARRGEATGELMHAFAESWKGPFWDRASYFGDPDQVDVPIGRLLDDARIARRAARFRPTLAVPVDWYALPLAREDRPAQQPDNAGTSHLCVVDAEGNVASITTTVNLPFGARYTAAGMVMNDEMDDFASEVGEQNAFGLPGGAANLPAPGKRPVSTMTPTIVFDEAGRPVLCVGAAGGSRIVTATEQVAWHALVRGLEPNEALAHPRVHHQGVPDTLRVETERPLDAATIAALRARGHTIEEVGHSAIVQLIRIRPEGSPRLVAVSDPRKGGRPAGE